MFHVLLQCTVVGHHGASGPYVTVRVETAHVRVTEVARSQNPPSMEPNVKETAFNTKCAMYMFVKVSPSYIPFLILMSFTKNVRR